jgi:hypothetical protein
MLWTDGYSRALVFSVTRTAPTSKRTKRLTRAEIDALVASLTDDTLNSLVVSANAEDRKRFDERCAAHPANRR